MKITLRIEVHNYARIFETHSPVSIDCLWVIRTVACVASEDLVFLVFSPLVNFLLSPTYVGVILYSVHVHSMLPFLAPACA